MPNITICNVKNNLLFMRNSLNRIFTKKEDAIQYLEQNKNLNLFSEDKSSNNGSKSFIVCDRETIYKISHTQLYNLHENYEGNQPVKFFMDIDIKLTYGIDVDPDTVLSDALKLVNSTLSIDPKYIVLSACREDKISFHVIFINIIFQNIDDMKYYMSKINIKNTGIDICVYRPGCLRMMNNSKRGRSHILNYYSSNYDTSNEEAMFMDTLLTNITDNYSIITVQREKEPIRIYEYLDIEIDNWGKTLNMLNPERFKNYGDWIEIGIIIKNLNPTEEGLVLWDKLSKKSDKYNHEKGIDDLRYRWNYFKITDHERSIANLMSMVKTDEQKN